MRPEKIEALVAVIKTLVEACKNGKCIYCPRSFGTAKRVYCQFKIKPREVTRENMPEFIDSFVEVEGLRK